MPSEDADAVFRHIDATFPDSVTRLQELLRFASVGVDPRRADDTLACARWLAGHLADIGMAVDVRGTPGMPVVVAHDRTAPAGAPHLLYFGHYDVQPEDPVSPWRGPPFEPVLVDGPHGRRVVARGAVDDKGQLMCIVEALRAWKTVHGRLPVRVTLMIEGEEECGSTHLDAFLDSHRDELAADVCVISDTEMLGVDRPAITYLLRGMCYAEVTLHGPAIDLHSGSYGGGVVNPINALCRILAQLHDDQGRVQVTGFYGDVGEPSEGEAAAWRDLGFDEAAFLAGAGLAVSTGEAGRSLLERLWARPTCDVNGIWGGYTGTGAKTVIAAQASAKLSCRLVPDQDPAAVMGSLERFFVERTPPGCRLEFTPMGAAPAIRVPTGSVYLEAVRAAACDVFGRPPALIGCGGSIPVVASIKRLLGLDTILIGFGLDDDGAHGPNEKFELVCYRRGILTHAAMLGRFAALSAA